MEVLKMKKVLFATVLMLSSFVFSQGKSIPAAFEDSYTKENAGKYEEAIKEIKDVYNEGSYPINLRLAWLYYEAKNYTTSISYYKKAMNLMPAATEPIWGIINVQVAQEKWTDVEKSYLSILKLDPKNASANYQLGLIYYYRKNYTLAKKFFDVSLNLYPFDYNSLLMSAWTNYFLGKTSEAKVLFNRVLLHYKNDSSAMEGLSLIKN